MKYGKYFILGLSKPELLELVNHHYDVLKAAYTQRILTFDEISFICDVESYRNNELTFAHLRDSAVCYLAGINIGFKYDGTTNKSL